MKHYPGIISSPGIAIGKVVKLNHDGMFLQRIIHDSHREKTMIQTAIALAREELADLKKRAKEEEKDIFTFQEMLLQDDELLEQIDEYISRGVGSAEAVERAAAMFAKVFSSQSDAYLQARHADVLDACQRVVDILDGRPRTRLLLTDPVILASDEFFPSDIVGLGRGMILGLAAGNGSPHSHASIIARGLGIPVLVGLGSDFLRRCDGRNAVLNGETGVLTLEPNRTQLTEAQRAMESLSSRYTRERERCSRPCLTKDGTLIQLSANALDADSVEDAIQAGVRSIGLLRSEFLLSMDAPPREEEQYRIYRRCMAAARGHEITVRTFDLGSDKGDVSQYTVSMNPALGMRGIRIGVTRPQLLRDQLCALLRVSTGGNLRIAFPMVTCLEDWRYCQDQLDQAMDSLAARGIPFDPNVKAGIVIDTPAAAICVEELILSGPDFVLLSVNDLTQYTYAADRMNLQVRNFYKPQGRAVSLLLRSVLECARRYGKPVSLCGVGMMSAQLCEWYVRAGARSLVVPTRSISEVSEILSKVDLRQM